MLMQNFLFAEKEITKKKKLFLFPTNAVLDKKS